MKKRILRTCRLGMFFSILLIISTVFPMAFQGEESGGITPVVRVRHGEQKVSAAQEGKCDQLIAEGKRLFTVELDYEGAASKFEEARALAVTRAQRVDIYFYLSLVYYSIKGEEEVETYTGLINKLLELDYSHLPDELLCPPRYIEIFSNIRKQYGALRIQSKPVGAEIHINNKKESAGKTPLVVGIRAGSVRIDLKKGKLSKKIKFKVEAGKEESTPVYTLKRKSSLIYILGGAVVLGGGAAALLLNKEKGSATGSIQVNSTPLGARVYLDGSDTGQVSNSLLSEVSEGSHTVKLIKEGYVDAQQSVTVTGDQTATANIPLSAHTITIEDPTSETVWVTGEEVEIKWSAGGTGNSVHLQMANELARGDLSIAGWRWRAFNPVDRKKFQHINIDVNNRWNSDRESAFIQGAVSNPSSIEGNVLVWQEELKRIPVNTPHRLNKESMRTFLSPEEFFRDSQTRLPFMKTSNEIRLQTLSNIKIELYKEGILIETLAESTPNSGSFIWSAPVGLAEGMDYRVKVLCAEETGVNDESENFWVVPGYEYVTQWGTFGYGNVEFQTLQGVAVDTAGNVYVVDGGNNHVFKYTNDGIYLLEWGQNGTSESRLNDPNRIHIDQTEKVYVVDSGGNCVNVYSSNGEFIDKYVETAGGEALFGHPLAVAVDDSGYIYVSDHIDQYDEQEYIKKLAPDGTFITRWGGRGSGDGQLSNVESLIVDREGYVYVSDGGNNRIQKFTNTGVFVKKWGTNGPDDGQFQSPFGIALDNSGLLYVADLKNHRIQKFTSEGKFIMTWGEHGSGDYQFFDAADVAVDGQGNVFVADQNNNRIMKFRPRGTN